MRKVGILLSLVLVSSVSLASAEVDIPKGESESIALHGVLPPDDLMIFRVQAAMCDELLEKVANEPALTRPQVYAVWRTCMIEHLDVNKSFMTLLDKNNDLTLQNIKLLEQNVVLKNETEQITEDVKKLAEDSRNDTYLGMGVGVGVTLGGVALGIIFINKKRS